MTLIHSASSSTDFPLPCPPRYGTRRTPERPTLGPKIGEVARNLGRPLLPWQQYVVDVATEFDPDTGLPAYSEVDLILPRQQGKTCLLEPVMTHRCMATGPDGWGGPQRVMYTAQTADAAREKWREIHYEHLRRSAFRSLFEPRFRLGQEAFLWSTGSVWSPGSTTGKTSGTGDTLDLGMIDEAWSRADSRTELGMRPAMMTRPKRQIWVTSMIPGLSRVIPAQWPYLRNKRRAGRARVEAGVTEGVAYFEWGAADDMDPADPATWWTALPGLGLIVTEKAIREDFEAMVEAGNLVDFEAEYLSREPQVSTRLWQTIGEQTWAELFDDNSVPAEPIAFGISASNERSWGSIVSSSLRLDGDVHTELVDRQPGVEWMGPRLEELIEAHDPCAIGVARDDQAASMVMDLKNRHPEMRDRILSAPGPDVTSACGRWFDATGEVATVEPDEDGNSRSRRVHHIGQAELTSAVAGAVKHQVGDKWRWARAASDVDVSPLYGSTMGLWAGDQVEWLGGAYDISETLG